MDLFDSQDYNYPWKANSDFRARHDGVRGRQKLLVKATNLDEDLKGIL